MTPPHASDADAAPPGDRGQTLNDFVVGVALFLLVVGYTFAFLPTVFQPFGDPGGSETKRVDRTADLLVGDLLAEDTADPGELNETCTQAFFDEADVPPDCQFDRSLQRIAAVPDTTELNVTVTRDGAVVDDGGTTFTRGATVSQAPNVARSVRIATYDGRDVRVVVEAW